MNPLNRYPGLRSALYLVQWVVNGILGAIAVVLVALGESPLWFVITSGVFNFLWSYAGLTAQGNVTPRPVTPVEIVNSEPVGDDFYSGPYDEPLFKE